MTRPLLPLITEPAELAAQLNGEGLLIVDLSKPDIYARAHIPGALHLDYAQIVVARPPVMGLMPDDASLSALLSSIGLTRELHVAAYDDEGGGRAARLLWTLDVAGHKHYSLLNGGLRAWAAEQLPLTHQLPAQRPAGHYPVTDRGPAITDMAYILTHLGDPAVALLDTRSPQEYRGEKRLAERAGHIPGAVNFDWVNAMDLQNNLKLRTAAELRERLEGIGVTPDKEVIVYCQTHHRSAHTWVVLKNLGYTKIRGYPGSWSEWGNHPSAPVE